MAERRPIGVKQGPLEIEHPINPSDCYGVVMMRNYCEYEFGGQLKNPDGDFCGACVGAAAD